MSARRSDMASFIAELRQRVPRDLHPMARQFIHEWFNEALDADERGDHGEVARLLAAVRAKVADELRWEAQKAQTGRDYKHADRLRRQAARIEARP